MWPDRRITELFKIEYPILLAPMAGVMDQELAIAVAEGGGLASLPCAMITPERAREQVNIFRQRVKAPINLNFFVIARSMPIRRARRPGGSGLRLTIRSWDSILRRRSMPPTARRSMPHFAKWSRN